MPNSWSDRKPGQNKLVFSRGPIVHLGDLAAKDFPRFPEPTRDDPGATRPVQTITEVCGGDVTQPIDMARIAAALKKDEQEHKARRIDTLARLMGLLRDDT